MNGIGDKGRDATVTGDGGSLRNTSANSASRTPVAHAASSQRRDEFVVGMNAFPILGYCGVFTAWDVFTGTLSR
jgi:hypothetical protein